MSTLEKILNILKMKNKSKSYSVKFYAELKLEDAYYITKAKLSQSKLATLQNEKNLSQERKKMAWTNVGAGSNIGKTSVPKFRDAWSAYQWHRDNK